MIYETKKAFKKAVEEKFGTIFTDMAWQAVLSVLEKMAIHNCYDDIDVEDAVETLGKLKEIYDGM